MTTNFGFLEGKQLYESFAGACLEAENALVVSPATTAILTRRALELAVKWLYSHDEELKLPYQDNLSSLVHEPSFRQVVDAQLFHPIRYIIKLGNVAVHTNAMIKREEAILSLRNLHQFISWIDYCYSDEYTAPKFDESLLKTGKEKRERPEKLKELYEQLSSKDRRLEEMMKENEELRAQLRAKREKSFQDYDFEVDKLSEFETRKKYIDLDLKLAGWKFGSDIAEEYKVDGMPNREKIGFADYVLFGDDGKPLAVIEAKRTSVDPKKGKEQAKLYADCLEKMTGQRPIIFYTNGYETYLWDDLHYPARLVSGIYTKEDLALMIDRRTSRKPLRHVEIQDRITNRDYQKQAILDVCQALEQKQRKMLLVMATGTGKTRTAISIVDVLTRHNWVKNVLFLADRTALVLQAKKNFSHLLPNMTMCSLLDNKENPEQARIVFSTYPTIMNAIDEAKRANGRRLFTVGHFDLIIIDESHRSIYKKYRSIFDYFDGLLLGLTATPKQEVDKNTYEIFELENGVPTFAYELEQAVKDGYLVDYHTIETTTKFLEEGIKYDELSPEEKEEYEDTFGDSDDVPTSEAMNEWLFNQSTIDIVLQDLMEKGLKVEGGDKLGKTIIFAKNHRHAEFIVERFDKLYPHLKGHFARVIDNQVKYSQQLIDDFSDPSKYPQIAVSVDMLDTGIDVPEVVNLVFFKKVRSKAKFWQMIGRGTRLCKDLFGIGQDKDKFLCFDYCGNFEFFRENPKGIESRQVISLTERLFLLKVQVIKELQALKYQKEEFRHHRINLIEDVMEQIHRLDEEHHRVRQQIRWVHKYKNRASWDQLTDLSLKELRDHIAPLLLPVNEEETAKRFDALLYQIEIAKLSKSTATRWVKDVMRTAEELSKLGSIPQVKEQEETLQRVQSSDFWKEAGLFDLEHVRIALRDIIRFLEKDMQQIYYTSFTDKVLEVKESGAFFDENDLQNYRKKVSQYLQEHQDELAIYKLRHNKPLTEQDRIRLEEILWKELGTKEEYRKEYGDTPITKLIREIVGLDPQAANEAFSKFLTSERLNANQSRFVKLIVDYVVKNGWIEREALTEEPFRSVGSIVELFHGQEDDVQEIMAIIDQINANMGVDQFAGA